MNSNFIINFFEITYKILQDYNHLIKFINKMSKDNFLKYGDSICLYTTHGFMAS
jgi:hypothetical protein